MPSNEFPPNPSREASVAPTDSATNRFSDSFFERRLLSLGKHHRELAPSPEERSAICLRELNDLKLGDVPIHNARAIVSPRDVGFQGCEEGAELVPFQVKDLSAQLYALVQSSDTAHFSIVADQRRLHFFFDPGSESLVLQNFCRDDVQLQSGSGAIINVTHHAVLRLAPGPWRIMTVLPSGETIPFADVMIFGRRYALHKGDVPTQSAGSKRRGFEGPPTERTKRLQATPETSVGQELMLGENESGTSSQGHALLQLVDAGNPLLDFGPGQQVVISSQADPDRPPIASTSGENYKLIWLRGIALRKANASVFSAEHNVHGTVAVKVIRTRTLPYDQSVIRLAQDWAHEEAVLRRLNHPSIIRFFGADARLFSLYMEHLQHPDLAKLCRKSEGYFYNGSDTKIPRVLREISAALVYLHDQSILHNDIKPSNIIYAEDRGAVLIDFGLASVNSTKACNGGTPWYVPQEYLNDRQRGSPSDIFALGVTLLYLLRKTPLPEFAHPEWKIAVATKESPEGKCMQRWLEKIEDMRDGLTGSEIEEIVANMLSESPEERIAAKEILENLTGL